MAFKKLCLLKPIIETEEYETVGELAFYSARVEELIVVYSAFKSDGASIPRMLWTLVGTPFDPRWIYESILHDFLCRNGVYPRSICDEIFFDALSENPYISNNQAQTFYNGVRIGSIYMEDRYETGNRLGESLA